VFELKATTAYSAPVAPPPRQMPVPETLARTSPAAGVVSGSALLIDYVLTITTSVAGGADALFSMLPPEWAQWNQADLAPQNQLGARTSDATLAGVLGTLKKRPLDYFKMFYADTALFGAYDATVCGLGFFGADHVLFASDAPFDPEKGPMYIRETIAIVDRLPVTEAEREKIYWRNAVELLKL